MKERDREERDTWMKVREKKNQKKKPKKKTKKKTKKTFPLYPYLLQEQQVFTNCKPISFRRPGEEIRTKQDLSYISICSLSILYNSEFIFNGTYLGTNAVVITRFTVDGKSLGEWVYRKGGTIKYEGICLPYKHEGSSLCGKKFLPLRLATHPSFFLWLVSIHWNVTRQ